MYRKHPETPGPALRRRTRIRAACALLLALVAVALAGGRALAHPHVWVTMKTELVYAADGALTGVRHAWTFDEMFSTFATQGLQSKTKGVFTQQELAPLAEVNVTSLKEFDYFTRARANGKAAAFTDPVDYWLEFTEGLLTLHFTLPLKSAVKARALDLEIYDPTWFVDFSFAEKTPVALVGAPANCQADVARPNSATASKSQPVGEDFFNSLTAGSTFGAQFANKVLVKCP
jgi:ABC-type uncharacterized transport system substrate-binding protein